MVATWASSMINQITIIAASSTVPSGAVISDTQQRDNSLLSNSNRKELSGQGNENER